MPLLDVNIQLYGIYMYANVHIYYNIYVYFLQSLKMHFK